MVVIRSEKVMLADEVELNLDVEYHNGEAFEAEVTIYGTFYIDGPTRNEFTNKLKLLVSEYRV